MRALPNARREPRRKKLSNRSGRNDFPKHRSRSIAFSITRVHQTVTIDPVSGPFAGKHDRRKTVAREKKSEDPGRREASCAFKNMSTFTGHENGHENYPEIGVQHGK